LLLPGRERLSRRGVSWTLVCGGFGTPRSRSAGRWVAQGIELRRYGLAFKIWLRILLCGVVAGFVWYLLSSLLLALFARPFLDWAQAVGTGSDWSGAAWFIIDLAMGIWVAWLYATLVPRFGSRPRTALIAGLAWWVLKSLQSAKWAGLGFIPGTIVLAPFVVSLAASLAAAAAAAWLYDGMGRRRPATPHLPG
jgi:hypothetical protein